MPSSYHCGEDICRKQIQDPSFSHPAQGNKQGVVSNDQLTTEVEFLPPELCFTFYLILKCLEAEDEK